MVKQTDRYLAIAIQTANPNAMEKKGIQDNLDRCKALIDMAFVGFEKGVTLGFPIKLVCFPEFVIQGIPYLTVDELKENNILVRIPGEETDQLVEVAKTYDIYIETGSYLEWDPEWPNQAFNTACIIGPNGIEAKYRKVNPFIPIEFFASPHSLEGYAEELFPVAKTPIGNLAVAICYDFIHPEPFREFTFKGAEVLIRASAYMPPWTWEPPTNWWTTISQVRSLENVVYGVHVNQGCSLAQFPPWGWPGGTCIVDYEGRVLSQTLASGEQLVVGHIDMANLREWRANGYTHLMPTHCRTECYTWLDKPQFPKGTHKKTDPPLNWDVLHELIDNAKMKLWPELEKYKRK